MNILLAVSGYKTYFGLFLYGLGSILEAVGHAELGTPIKLTGEGFLTIGAGHKMVKKLQYTARNG